MRDSGYVSGRVNDWVKKTCAQRETLAIAGFALDGSKWDGLYLGRRKGRDLIYAGKVVIRKTQPYSKKIAHKGIWVEPSLLAEIEYRAKSAEGKVRHPFFKGKRGAIIEGETRMRSVFGRPDDQNREIIVTVIVVPIPKVD